MAIEKNKQKTLFKTKLFIIYSFNISFYLEALDKFALDYKNSTFFEEEY